jgi:hypothetical protein
MRCDLSRKNLKRLFHQSFGYNEACSAFIGVTTRQLAHQPEADFVSRLQHLDCSPCCYPSYPPKAEPELPSLTRVTLSITIVIDLDTTPAQV